AHAETAKSRPSGAMIAVGRIVVLLRSTQGLSMVTVLGSTRCASPPSPREDACLRGTRREKRWAECPIAVPLGQSIVRSPSSGQTRTARVGPRAGAGRGAEAPRMSVRGRADRGSAGIDCETAPSQPFDDQPRASVALGGEHRRVVQDRVERAANLRGLLDALL